MMARMNPGEITQFFQMSLDFGRTKSQFRSGYNWSEGSVIVQKKKEIPGLPNPGLNVFPIFEKMLHDIFFLTENYTLILSPNAIDTQRWQYMGFFDMLISHP